MINKILPATITNNYQGKGFAKYTFLLITAITIIRSLIHIFFEDGGAASIAGIRLNEFENGGAETVVAIFALWGLSQLLLGLVFLGVYLRYKSLIPLMYLFIFLEYAGRLGLGLIKSISTSYTPPGVIGNYIAIPLALIMFYYALPKATSKES